MRRSMPALALTGALLLAVAPAAVATGPGGWDHVGVGAAGASSLDGVVNVLNAQNPGVLYAGGSFTRAGGNGKAQRIARWNGSTWAPLGATPLTNGAVHALAYRAGKVYVGGTFLNAGGNAGADFLAVWDGSTWAPFCTSQGPDATFNGNVNALQIVGNTLYVGGAFQNGAAITSADYLLACDLTTGVSSSTVLVDDDLNGAVYALTADSSGTLYAGGQFINVAGIPDADHIASFDGAWHALGTGVAVDSFVRSLAASGTDVYVGTDSVNIAGIANADHVARWNGSAWSAVGSNTAGTDGWFPSSSFVYALTTFGSTVVAAGSFQNANGTTSADDIAAFDGSQWRPIGSDGAGNGPFIGTANAVTTVSGRLYVGGSFTSAGGDPKASFVASYALRLPDASIGGTAQNQGIGVHVYHPTGAGEVRHVAVTRGKDATSYVRIHNDGLVAASFALHGLGGAKGIKARWFAGGQNVTSKVEAGTYTTGAIPARGSVVVRVVVDVAKSSAKTATITTRVGASGAPDDAVRIGVTAKG